MIAFLHRWLYTRILRRCWGCGIRMLSEHAEWDQRVIDGECSTLETTFPTGERYCYSCIHYPEG